MRKTMMSPEGNIELYRLLGKWYPVAAGMPEGEDFDFDSEIYDSMDVIFRHRDDVEAASAGVQGVFRFSFEETVPLGEIRPVVMEAFEIIELYKEP
ncbi:MAG TPA: YugE family protein [Candidatus Salinicoccus stercoripullorum]|uniref:YugE family protein n=1 Tax=Candidatus Salinicoccus stercoripullorum TaxID=2838756 RepID=A0A9D1QFV8_9STAP|nr:YugE family protein [Candidatus Salinicoccus stercoripullorum]